MPVIINPDDFELWLDPTVEDPAAIEPLLRPAAEDFLTHYPVDVQVNRPGCDDHSCIEPV